MTTVRLSSIFQDTKSGLAQSLSGLVLPKDIQEVQSRIAQYLNTVCDENNEFRQNLTQSEDYILQAALSMLNAQRDLVDALNHTPQIEVVENPNSSECATDSSSKQPFENVSSIGALLGGGGGALVGKLFIGGWGSVFGAIAGTAVAIYMSQQKSQGKSINQRQSLKLSKQQATAKIVDVPVDANTLIHVIGQICDSLDHLVETFRSQIKRVVNKYESQEKPSIEREYRVLLEGIQSLVGFKRGHSEAEPKFVEKLQTRIEDLAELLDNYDLTLVDYSADTENFFEEVSSPNVTAPKMVLPAVMKNGVAIIRGKVFVAENKYEIDYGELTFE